MEVQDENAISVRCSSCGQTITLRESSAEKDYRDKSEARRERSEKVPINYFVEWLPILISVPLALLFLLLTCILPKFFPAALGAGFVIAASGFGKSCTLAGKEGNYVGPDYLDVLGGHPLGHHHRSFSALRVRLLHALADRRGRLRHSKTQNVRSLDRHASIRLDRVLPGNRLCTRRQCHLGSPR
ncbi:MAG: hypothetical protein FJ303_23770 [Planctomycetes bacterium]|nr:hypothetical protein [Planctomycetota bacterium]